MIAPLFSRLSIVVLSLGLIVGIIAGFGFWYISPISVRASLAWPPIEVDGLTDSLPTFYRSTVAIEPVAFGGADVSGKVLQRQAENWASRMESTPFYDFVSGELSDLIPGIADSAAALHAPVEEGERDPTLIKRLDVKLEYGDLVTRVQVRAFGRTELEAALLAGAIPELFEDYLIAEEKDLRLAEYNYSLSKIDEVRGELAKARDELAALLPNADTEYKDLDAARFVAEAIVAALETQIVSLAQGLATFVAAGSVQEVEYQDILSQLERVRVELAEARGELDGIELKLEGGSLDVEYEAAQAKVAAFMRQLQDLSLTISSPPTDESVEEFVRNRFVAFDPAPSGVVSQDRVRGRNAVMMGAVLGIGGAWLGLNRKGVLGYIRETLRSKGSEGGEYGEDREDEV